MPYRRLWKGKVSWKMNKEQYMKALKKRLRRLPKSEFDRAVEYFEEYFQEAGPEQEQQAILDLGLPEEAADQIIQDMAVKNMEEPVRGVKKGMNAVWVGILAVCAAPVALPVLVLAFAMVILLLAMVAMVLAVLLACAVVVIVAGPVSVWGGFAVLTKSIPAALVCFGQGLIGVGLGLLLVWGLYLLIRKFLNWIVKLFGNMVKKGGGADA